MRSTLRCASTTERIAKVFRYDKVRNKTGSFSSSVVNPSLASLAPQNVVESRRKHTVIALP